MGLFSEIAKGFIGGALQEIGNQLINGNDYDEDDD